jgi:hypothetical protein
MIPDIEFHDIFGLNISWTWEHICQIIKSPPPYYEKIYIQKQLLLWIAKKYFAFKNIAVHQIDDPNYDYICVNKKFIVKCACNEHEISEYDHLQSGLVKYLISPLTFEKYGSLHKTHIHEQIWTPETFTLQYPAHVYVKKSYQIDVLNKCTNSKQKNNYIMMPPASGKTMIQILLCKNRDCVIFVGSQLMQKQLLRMLKSCRIKCDVLYNETPKKSYDYAIYDNIAGPECVCNKTFHFMNTRLQFYWETQDFITTCCELFYNIKFVRATDIWQDFAQETAPHIAICHENAAFHYDLLNRAAQVKYPYYIYHVQDDFKHESVCIDQYRKTGGVICFQKPKYGIDIGLVKKIYIKISGNICDVIGYALRQIDCEIVLIYDETPVECTYHVMCLYNMDKNLRHKISNPELFPFLH